VIKYPDIAPLLEKKALRRRRLARLPFEEKIEIVNKWRELSRQIRKLRQPNQEPTTEKSGERNGRNSTTLS
jgi:hypothetical protein